MEAVAHNGPCVVISGAGQGFLGGYKSVNIYISLTQKCRKAVHRESRNDNKYMKSAQLLYQTNKCGLK